MEKTVVALYDNLDTAQAAVQELVNNGFSRDDISVVRTNQQGDYTSGNITESGEGETSGAAAGAGIGAVLGGLAGLLVGLGALAIPGIGPIIAAGPLATALAGAGLGAATGGLVGALADSGIPESEAGQYAEGVRRGGTLVTVRVGEDHLSHATEILNRYTPVDINQRASEWQASGWTGYDASAGPYSTSSGAPHTQQAADMSTAVSGSRGAGMGMTAGGMAGASQGGDMGMSTEAGGQGYAKSSGSAGADYRTSTGLTGENSGGTYEGTGSAGYTGSGTVYEGGASYTGNVDRPNASDIAESPDRVGSSNWQDEDSVMRSGHGEMSTSKGFSGQGGGTYERMQDVDRTVHPRSAEGDYQARRDFLGGDQSEGENQSATSGMIETGHGSYGAQGQNYQSGTSDISSSKGDAWEGALTGGAALGGHQGALAGGGHVTEGDTYTERSSGDDMGTTGMTFGSGPSRSRFNRRFEDFDPDFRSDWETHYRSTGYGYERYQPAYQYGWQLGEQYHDRNWSDFESNVRTDWERSHPNDAWNDFRAAVRQGWERFRSGAERSQGAEQPYKGLEQGTQPGAAAQQDPRTFSYEARENLRSGLDSTMGDMSRGFDTYDQDFRRNWETSYRSSGFGYERYQPAYQYGYNLASDAKYRGRNWGDIESDIRRDWETRHPNDTWEDFKDAVRHAWDRVRAGLNG